MELLCQVDEEIQAFIVARPDSQTMHRFEIVAQGVDIDEGDIQDNLGFMLPYAVDRGHPIIFR